MELEQTFSSRKRGKHAKVFHSLKDVALCIRKRNRRKHSLHIQIADKTDIMAFFKIWLYSIELGAGIAQSVEVWAMGWTTEEQGFESR
jgi:hypothetical protein